MILSSRGKKKQEQRIVASIDKIDEAELKRIVKRMTPKEYDEVVSLCQKHMPEAAIRLGQFEFTCKGVRD